jgi:hypothetical protein
MLLAGKRREVLNLPDVHGGRLAGKGREGKDSWYFASRSSVNRAGNLLL